MDEIARKVFTAADFVIFGLLIGISASVGVFFAYRDRKRNTTDNYFLGNRKLSSLPVGLSFVVTFQSSILVLGYPAEAYAYGMQSVVQCIGIIIAYLLASIIVVPIFHPIKVTSVYGYYKLRYKVDSVRYLAMILGVIHYTFIMGVVIYGTALAMEYVANLPQWSSILMFSVSAVLYTSIGGFKAVIWTDVFQAVVMVTGICAVLIKSTILCGGSAEVLRLSETRLNFFDFNPDPTVRHTFWTLSIGTITLYIYLSITQAGIQRINSTPTQKTARMVFCIAAPVYSFIWILSMFQGLAAFAYFTKKGCDPLASGEISNLNQIIPFTIMELFHDTPGLSGLFVAAVASASLSTISSGLSSLATVTYEDVIKVFFTVRDTKGPRIAKLIVVIYGIIAVCFSFLLSNVSSIPLGQILVTFTSSITGPETGLFLLSILFRRATPRAMILATLSGMAFIFWLSSGQNFSNAIKKAPYLPPGPIHHCPLIQANNLTTAATSYSSTETLSENASLVSTGSTMVNQDDVKTSLQTFYSISYMYFNLIGVLVTIVVGTIASCLTAPMSDIDERTLLKSSSFLPTCLRRSGKTYIRDGTHVDMQPTEELVRISLGPVLQKVLRLKQSLLLVQPKLSCCFVGLTSYDGNYHKF